MSNEKHASVRFNIQRDDGDSYHDVNVSMSGEDRWERSVDIEELNALYLEFLQLAGWPDATGVDVQFD